MSPVLLLYGLTVFVICLCIHLLLWRIRRPGNEVLVLLLIFFIMPLLVICFSRFLYGVEFLSHPVNLATISLLHMALSSAYIATYPAAKATSPTLKILLIVASAMPTGLTRADIVNHVDVPELFSNYLKDLECSLIAKEGDGFVLTWKGRLTVSFFILFRRMLGLQIPTVDVLSLHKGLL